MNSKKSEYNDKSNNNVNNATGSNGAQSTAVPSLNNQFSAADVSPEQNAAAPIVEDASQKESPVGTNVSAAAKTAPEDQTRRFLDAVPDIYLKGFKELLLVRDLEDRQNAGIALIRRTVKNENAARIIQGLAGCAAILNTENLNNAAAETLTQSDAGKINFKMAIENLARVANFREDMSEGNLVVPKTLHNRALIVRNIMGDELLKEMIETGKIPQRGTELIQRMSRVGFSYVREASETIKPVKALEIAYQRQFVERVANYTVDLFRKEIAVWRLPKKASISKVAAVDAPEADAVPEGLCKEGQRILREILKFFKDEPVAEILRKALSLLLANLEVMSIKETNCQ